MRSSREERRVGGSEARTRDSLRATEDKLAKRKLTGFAERTNDEQVGSPAGLKGRREAEIDLAPKPDLRNSDGGRASPRERVRPLAFNAARTAGVWVGKVFGGMGVRAASGSFGCAAQDDGVGVGWEKSFKVVR